MEPKAVGGFEEKPMRLPSDEGKAAQKAVPKSILKKPAGEEKVETLTSSIESSGTEDSVKKEKLKWNTSTQVRVIWPNLEKEEMKESLFRSEKILGAEGFDMTLSDIEGAPSMLQQGMKAVYEIVMQLTSHVIVSPTERTPDPTTNPDKKVITNPDQIREIAWIVRNRNAFDQTDFRTLPNQDLFAHLRDLTSYRNKLVHKKEVLYSEKDDRFKKTIDSAIEKYDRYISKIKSAITHKEADILIDEEKWVKKQRVAAPDNRIENWSINDLKKVKDLLEKRLSTFVSIASLPSDETSKEKIDSIFETYSELLGKIDRTLEKKELKITFEDLEDIKLTLRQFDGTIPEEYVNILKHIMSVLNQANPTEDALKAKVEKAKIDCKKYIEQATQGPLVKMCHQHLAWISSVKQNIEQRIEKQKAHELEKNIATFEKQILGIQEQLELLEEGGSPKVRELLVQTIEGYHDLVEAHDIALLKRIVPSLIESFKNRAKSLDPETMQSMTMEQLEKEYQDYEEGLVEIEQKLEMYSTEETQLRGLLEELITQGESIKEKLRGELERRFGSFSEE